MATAARRRFCRCACFCSQNLYVARYGLHLRFRDEQQLRRDYGPVSGGRRRGPDTRTGFARGLSLQIGSSLGTREHACRVRWTEVFRPIDDPVTVISVTGVGGALRLRDVY